MDGDAHDRRAREVAYEARNNVQSHEKVCEERYTHINRRLDDICTKIDAMAGRWWKLALVVLTALLAVIGWLAERAF